MRSGSRRCCQSGSGQAACARSSSARSSSWRRRCPRAASDAQLQVVEGDSGVSMRLSRHASRPRPPRRACGAVAAGEEQPGVDPAAGGHGRPASSAPSSASPARGAAPAAWTSSSTSIGAPASSSQRATRRAVVGLERLALLHRGGELQAVLAAAHRRQRAADDLAVDGMRHAHRAATRPGSRWRRCAGPPCLADCPRAGQVLSSGNGSGSPSASSSTTRRSRLVESGHASLDQVDEGLAHRRPVLQAPQLPHLLQLPGRSAPSSSSRTKSAFPPLLRTPSGVPPARAGRRRRLGEGAGRVLVERRELEPQRARVLPQRDDRVLDRLAVADRGDDEGGAGRCRCSTTAADIGSSSCASSTPSTTGEPLPRSRRAAAPRRISSSGSSERNVRGQHVGERGERHRRGAARGLHPRDVCALALPPRPGLAGEPRLADARRPAQHRSLGGPRRAGSPASRARPHAPPAATSRGSRRGSSPDSNRPLRDRQGEPVRSSPGSPVAAY